MSTEDVVTYSVPKGAAYLTSQQTIVYATYFVFYVLLARVLTRDEIGQVSLLTAVLAAFNVLTVLALPSTATRFISRDLGAHLKESAGSVAKTVLRLTMTIAVPSTLSLVLVSILLGPQVFGSQGFSLQLAATAISGLLYDLMLLYGAYFLGVGDFTSQVYQNVLYFTLTRGSGLVLAILGLRVLGIVIGWIIGGATTLLLSISLWHGRLPHGKTHPVRPLLIFALPLFISSLISLAQQWGDIGILQYVLGQLSTTGGYYLAVTGVAFLSILWTPISGALLPALSSSHGANAIDELRHRVDTAIRLANLAVFPVSAALASIAPTALVIVYGSAYGSEALPFAILAISGIFTAQASIVSAALQAVGRTTKLLRITALGTVMDLIVVTALAKSLGPIAGGIGRLLLYASIVYLATRNLRPEFMASRHHGIMEAVTLGLAVGLPLFFTNFFLTLVGIQPILRLAPLLGVFALAYLTTVRTLRIFKRSDFAIFRDAFPQRLDFLLRKIETFLVRET